MNPIQGMAKFMRGLWAMPPAWRAWVGVLVAANALAPLFYLERTEAQLVLGTFAIAGLLMALITSATGFTRLLGLGHFPWLALLPWLWLRLGEIPADDFYGLWLRSLFVINTLSLAIDVADVGRYLRGDKEDALAGQG